MSGTKDQNPGQQQSKAADAVEDVMGSARAEEAYLGHPLPHSDKIENRLEKAMGEESKSIDANPLSRMIHGAKARVHAGMAAFTYKNDMSAEKLKKQQADHAQWKADKAKMRSGGKSEAGSSSGTHSA